MTVNRTIYRKFGPYALLMIMIFYCGALSAEHADGRFQSVEKLLEESSAARQIEDSGNSQALAGREQARVHYQKAKQADADGDDETAEAQLLLATKAMLQAVRMADQKDVVLGKKITDFQKRQDAIMALLEAHERITQDSGQAAPGKELHRLVEKNLAEANMLMDEDRVDDGKQLLDETYLATKLAVEKIRDGETLVRSLNFANKQEEYAYELDRNDTHLMLVRVLLNEKMKAERTKKQLQPLLDEADTLRNQAEQQAAKGAYGDAVTTLEESTRQVTRAIRMAGIYIPG